MKIKRATFYFGHNLYPVSENNLKLFPVISDNNDFAKVEKVIQTLQLNNRSLKIVEVEETDTEVIFWGVNNGFTVVYTK